MKVLHLISSADLYGAERTLCNLFAEAARIKAADPEAADPRFSLAVMTPLDRPTPLIAEAEARGVPTLILPAGLKDSPRALWQLGRALGRSHREGSGPDILHSHGYKGLSLALVMAKLFDLPLVHTQHGFIRNSRKLRFYMGLDMFLCHWRTVRRVICVSRTIRDEYLETGTAADKLALLPNAVPLPDLKVRPDTERTEAGPVCLAVCRLDWEKGPDILLDAFAQVQDEFPEARLWIAGDGPLRPMLEERTRELGLESRARFWGFTDRVAELLAQADMLLLPSRTEGMPMALLEAMSWGLPSVCATVGETPRLIDESGAGILTPTGSAEAFAQGLRVLLATGPAERRRMGQAGRDYVAAHCSMPAYMTRLRRIYAEAAGREGAHV